MSSQNFQLFTFIEVTLGESHKLARRDFVTALGKYTQTAANLIWRRFIVSHLAKTPIKNIFPES